MRSQRRSVSPLPPLPPFAPFLLLLLLVPGFPAPADGQTAAAPATPAQYAEALKYRHIGPEGNRVTVVAGVPGDPLTYYAGAASGGLWKSTDGGVHWAPLFDGEPVSSIGALAVAPSDPNVVWVGTGESYIRSNISVGWGMWRSTDAGKTWARAGLERSGRIGRIAVHPANPDVALVAAMGHSYGPQPERGVYRTTDGGRTWERVLFVNDSTGAIDLVMDPGNPRILYAATWQLEIRTWGRTSGGTGSGIWKSTDGGTTWKRLVGNGLPAKPFGKVGLAVSRSNPSRVYALIETSDGVPLPGFEPERGELWRSEDGGNRWTLVSYDREMAGRTHYYTRMAVAPDDPDEAYFLSASFSKTLDGGKSLIVYPFSGWPGWDHHDMWIDPANPARMAVASDCCVSVSLNRGATWHQTNLPIAQMYHVTVDNQVPYWVYSNRQDGPSAMGPSNSKTASWFGPGSITRGMWTTVGGGESGWATPDPEDPTLVWSSASGYGSGSGIVSVHDTRTRATRTVEVWPEAPFGSPAADLKYRFVWTFPLTISPHDRNRVYVGSQHVHVTTNRGQTWRELSPDLTRNDKSRQQISGGLTPDNIGVEYAGVVFAIAESRLERGLIWAGTNDGLVHLTRDGGATWTNVTANIPGLLPWGTISNIEPSRYDAGTAYLTVDGHQENNRDPWVYKTTDYGRSWRLIVGGLEKTPLSYAHVVREDPVRRGLLYLGTEGGLYVSFNDGERWQPLQTNLPHAPVHWLTVQEHFNDLVVATYGRGIWILDDLTPLQQMTAQTSAAALHLFAPRPAYRYRLTEPPWAALYDASAGTDPAYGASLHLWLREAPSDSVSLTVSDAAGAAVRTMKVAGKAGLNRVMWDLTADRTTEVRLRTAPLYAPEVQPGDTGRLAPDFGRWGLLVPPGTYTVRASAGGEEASGSLVVRKDPASGGSEAEIAAQHALLRSLQAQVNRAAGLVNGMEQVRAQLQALRARLTDVAVADVRAAADSLERRFTEVEGEVVQLKLTGRGQDAIRYPPMLAEKLLYLAGQLESSDTRPTDAQVEVAALLTSRLDGVAARHAALMTTDLPRFNAMLRDRGLDGVSVHP